ncbi:MAG TPA: dethiobiotin synthase [Parvularculaceae bacterium]|nr:dethiobiotin synthase [Parvularculaceae bacterium]
MSACFVTGSGTEVGKTYVGAAILRTKRAEGARARAIKPLMSGFSWDRPERSDAGVLLSACGVAPTRSAIADLCLYAFEPPLAPNVAARRAGVALDEAAILKFIRERIEDDAAFSVVEGAGGAMSPMTDRMLQIDLMEGLRLPVVFVAASYLGAISHSLTALEALDRRRLSIAAIVVAQPRGEGDDPAALIEELSRWRRGPFVAAPFGTDPMALGARISHFLGDA